MLIVTRRMLAVLPFLFIPMTVVGAADFPLKLPRGLQEQAAYIPARGQGPMHQLPRRLQFHRRELSQHRRRHGPPESGPRTPHCHQAGGAQGSYVARRPPYMHDGSVASLAEVIALYNRGARRTLRYWARSAPSG
jgi:hypothetical protein